MNHKQFYKELGRLMYAVAKADGAVRHKEVEALNSFVENVIAPFEHGYDSSGMNEAFYTYFEFEECSKNEMSAGEALNSFTDFMLKNKADFTPELREECIQAVDKIANAYKHVNKVEQSVLNKIKSDIKSV